MKSATLFSPLLNLDDINGNLTKINIAKQDTLMLSFGSLHEMAGRSTPDKLMSFKLALQLYRTFNYKCPTNDWLSINFNSVLTSRQNKFSINKTNRLKVGMNIL